jgi:putative transposase
MVRVNAIDDELWAVLEGVIPTGGVRRGRPWNDHRLTLEGICWRFRTCSPWRDLPTEFGAWQSVWERHRRWSADGTYELMFAAVKKTAGMNAADLDGLLSVDSTSAKVHQHAGGAPKNLKRGWVELQETDRRTA